MPLVAAPVMKVGSFASLISGTAASTLGVKSGPIITCTFSRTTSSWTRRFTSSGLGPVVSRLTSSILRPATVVPCFCWNSLTALSLSCPERPDGPE